MMDPIYQIANYLHLTAVLYLLIEMWRKQDCSGISGQTQVLLALVYTTRYLDLIYIFVSITNSSFKIFYLILGYSTVLSIYAFFRKTHEQKYDTFRSEILLTACLVIAVLINHSYETLEVLWTFSIYLETVAMLPQFHFVAKAGRVHKHVFVYIALLGAYKGLYIAHWIYRYSMQGLFDNLATAAGIVQFLLFIDFFARVTPYLNKSPPEEEEEQEPAVESADSERGEPVTKEETKKENLNCIISTIVLTPASLIETTNDKANLLSAEAETAKN